jgi:hypothetical protein
MQEFNTCAVITSLSSHTNLRGKTVISCIVVLKNVAGEIKFSYQLHFCNAIVTSCASSSHI